MGGYFSTPYGNDRISQLMLEGGDIAAQGAQRSGQIWGGALSNIGQIASNAFQQYGEEKKVREVEEKKKAEATKMAVRDAAWTEAVETWDGTDPKKLYATASKIYGDPKTAAVMTQGVMSFHSITGKGDAADEENTLNLADAVASGKITAPMWERWGPGIQAKVGPVVVKRLGAPPESVQQPWTFEQAVEGAKALQLTRKAEKPDKPSPGHMVTVPGPNGPMARLATDEELAKGVPIYREPKAPAAPKKPKLEKVETVIDGKTVTTWVEPKLGATYAKPTGQAKPATGQQRKALNYFNRGKEASETVSGIEDKIADYGPIDQARLAAGGSAGGFLSNIVKSDEMQSYRQAQRAFTEARLRKDSGAAIKEEEYDADARTYFAVPGDSKATIEQKRRSRQAILAGVAFEAGDALREFYGDEAEGMIQNYRQMSQPGGGTAPPPPPSAGAGLIAPGALRSGTFKPQTQAQYDAMPSGTIYIGKDGRQKQKQ